MLYSLSRVIACCAFLAGSASAHAEQILFESGTLGPTGLTRDDLANETVRGTNVNFSVFTGVRFFLESPVVTSKVGGHFIKTGDVGETFFGAIVELDDENDFPDSGDLTTSDVLGHTLLTFPETSDEVFGDLKLNLDPGWHALVFGSRLFDADGTGAALRNNPDIGSPDYIAFQTGFGWNRLSNPIFRNHSFFVRGRVIPEPSCLVSLSLCITACLGSKLLARCHCWFIGRGPSKTG